MSERKSRRQKRLERKIPMATESELREKATELAIGEVDRFRQSRKRWPDPGEIEKMSESVYEQIKNEVKKKEKAATKITGELPAGENEGKGTPEKTFLEKRRERRKRERNTKRARKEKGTEKGGTGAGKPAGVETPTKTGTPQKTGKTGAIKDLLGEESMEETGADTETGEFKKLASLDELSSLETGLSEKDGSDLIEKEAETDKNACPNCSNKAKEIIYCPNCGKAFCDHCANKVEPTAGKVKYTCPHCNSVFGKKSRG